MTERYAKRGEEHLVSYSFPEGRPKDFAKTENMYRDYSTDRDCIESFPGYRKLESLNAKIWGIYPEAQGDSRHYLVHAGANLFRCSFDEEFLDSMTSVILCDMADHQSTSYRHGDLVYIFDSVDITVVGPEGDAEKVSENDYLPYMPTTFKNLKEHEQPNLISPYYFEEYKIDSVAEISYGTPELKFRITSESKGTCQVIGADSGTSGRVDIPNRVLINGKYYRVTDIAPAAFRNFTGITSVFIGSQIEKIGIEAFYGCTGITWAMLGEGLLEIDDLAFGKCTSLAKIYLGLDCKRIGTDAFKSCEKLTSVYYFGTANTIGAIDGLESIASCMIYYKCNFTNNFVSIPICTPSEEILMVTKDDTSIEYSPSIGYGLVKIPYSHPGDLEGSTIKIMGYRDTTLHMFSDRRTPFNNVFDEILEGYDAVHSCSKSAEFDGRYHIFGSEELPHLIFSTSYTESGLTHPLYFGALDYTVLGSADSAVTSLSPIGNRLAVTKRGDNFRGRIYILRPDGEEGALYGRRLDIKQIIEDADLYSDGFSHDGDLYYLSSVGIMRLNIKSDISPGTLENITEDYTSELDIQALRNCIFSKLSGYLAVFGGGELLLGDSRQAYRSDGGHTQFRWYKITDVCAHPGDRPVFYYAHEAPRGYYIHIDEGKETYGEVISYADEEGTLRFYEQIGIRKFAVVPGDEVRGGTPSLPTAVCQKEMSLIFGTECGDIFAINTDKRGTPPRDIYESEGFDPEEYKAAFGGVIHPHHYSAAGHRMRFSVKTESSDGGIPYLEKSTVRGSLVARLERRSSAPINVVVVTDGDRVTKTALFPLGELDFSDLDFGRIAMTSQSAETHTLPEKERNWVKKQIIIYTDDCLAPFAIQSLSYAYKIKGRIKNR